MQQVVALSKDIQVEAWLSGQVEDIEDEVKAVFKARGETAEDKPDKVDEIKLPELSAEEVVRMGLPAVPTIWEPMAAVPKLDFKVINLPEELIFATQCAGEPIGGFGAGVESVNLPTQNKGTECFIYYTLADQISMVSCGCKSKQDLPI